MQEQMIPDDRGRDFSRERRERDSFLLLLHLYSLSEGTLVELPGDQVARDLGFEQREVRRLVHHLEVGGYVRSLLGERVSITTQGMDYIERGARRRHSVRLGDSSRRPSAGTMNRVPSV